MLAINQIAFLVIIVSFVWSLFSGASGAAKITLFLCILFGGAITLATTEHVNSPAYQETK